MNWKERLGLYLLDNWWTLFMCTIAVYNHSCIENQTYEQRFLFYSWIGLFSLGVTLYSKLNDVLNSLKGKN